MGATAVSAQVIVELLGLLLQQDGVELGVVGDLSEGLVEHRADVGDLVSGLDAARDVLLALAHLLRELVFQGGDLNENETNMVRCCFRYIRTLERLSVTKGFYRISFGFNDKSSYANHVTMLYFAKKFDITTSSLLSRFP